jgi:hypothetical protein
MKTDLYTTQNSADCVQPLVRPDSPGFFWRLFEWGRNGAQWHIVTAKVIDWADDDDGERVLACTGGGCWHRCDMINREGYDDGSRYFRATPPTWPNDHDQTTAKKAP